MNKQIKEQRDGQHHCVKLCGENLNLITLELHCAAAIVMLTA